MTDHWRKVPGKFHDDPTAIDGKRFIASTHGWRQIVQMLRNMSNNRCQGCGVQTLHGDTHHVYGRGLGGGKREDRVLVNGVVFLWYLCRLCHEHTQIRPWGSWRDNEIQAVARTNFFSATDN